MILAKKKNLDFFRSIVKPTPQPSRLTRRKPPLSQQHSPTAPAEHRQRLLVRHQAPVQQQQGRQMERVPRHLRRALPPANRPRGFRPISPWHSPVPYLFGGLAAMLGLIAFALLILACSYLKLSGDGDERDVERGGAKGDGGSDDNAPPVFEEKFLVIMAGDQKPTFLATPVSNSITNSCLNDDSKGMEKDKLGIMGKGEAVQENGDGANESSQACQEQSH
ncbi:Protein GLUTAMINE DUMPER 3 [Striga hermonthica]|uniref:Protein GLUTAMINE DUMPER 3 n=1 Tax=Striga hermonthica TaxID=68872 RepID=A0A9N7MV54_STRHE|nr:Protein GLUTAMINE DUMPER 3 [Striga hermonthica]